MLSHISYVQLFMILWTVAPRIFSDRVFQAKILKWVAASPPKNLLNPDIELPSPMSPATAGRFFTAEP